MVPQTPETESTRSVNFLASAMPAEETLSELADLFHVLGDLTRIRILCALSISELRVSEIAELLSMSSSAISHQLRVLRQARLVRLTRNLDGFVNANLITRDSRILTTPVILPRPPF